MRQFITLNAQHDGKPMLVNPLSITVMGSAQTGYGTRVWVGDAEPFVVTQTMEEIVATIEEQEGRPQS